MALPKSNRLSLRFNRDRLTKTGITFFGRFFTLVSAKPEKAISSPRFAILVSKKTAKLAVDRNLIKRRISTLFFENLSSIPPFDYLIIPKHQVLKTNYSDLQKDLREILSKISHT